MYRVTLSAFEGPIDLLLQLIERTKLDITQIALAQIADQYLTHVRSLEAPEPRALAEFVALAARLLLIKSRTLLPPPIRAETAETSSLEDDAEALTRQLREYQRYKQAALRLQEWQAQGRQTFVRTAVPTLPILPTVAWNDTRHYTLANLTAAWEQRMQLLQTTAAASPLPLPPRLTVAEVVQHIRDRLGRQAWFSFEDWLALTCTRQEIVVSFWAVLELLKRRVIMIEQAVLFGPISIGRGTAWNTGQISELDGIDVLDRSTRTD